MRSIKVQGSNLEIFQLKNVNFKYKKEYVFSNLNITIENGFYGIIGPNGSGKSTLIELIAGLLLPEKGEIFFQNKNILNYRRKELAKYISFVPQNFYINFPYTVFEIVSTGRYPWKSKFQSFNREDYEIIENAIKICDLEKLKNVSVLNLSGGERQRAIFARSIAQNSEIMLLDEATSNLDIKHTLKILDYLKFARKNVIAIFHNLNLAKIYSEKIIMLKKGKIFKFGKSKDIFNLKNLTELFEVEEKRLKEIVNL